MRRWRREERVKKYIENTTFKASKHLMKIKELHVWKTSLGTQREQVKQQNQEGEDKWEFDCQTRNERLTKLFVMHVILGWNIVFPAMNYPRESKSMTLLQLLCWWLCSCYRLSKQHFARGRDQDLIRKQKQKKGKRATLWLLSLSEKRKKNEREMMTED